MLHSVLIYYLANIASVDIYIDYKQKVLNSSVNSLGSLLKVSIALQQISLAPFFASNSSIPKYYYSNSSGLGGRTKPWGTKSLVASVKYLSNIIPFIVYAYSYEISINNAVTSACSNFFVFLTSISRVFFYSLLISLKWSVGILEI